MDNTDSPDNVKKVRRRSMEKRKNKRSRSPKKAGLNRLFEPRRCRRCAGCRAIEKQNQEKLLEISKSRSKSTSLQKRLLKDAPFPKTRSLVSLRTDSKSPRKMKNDKKIGLIYLKEPIKKTTQ